MALLAVVRAGDESDLLELALAVSARLALARDGYDRWAKPAATPSTGRRFSKCGLFQKSISPSLSREFNPRVSYLGATESVFFF